MKIFALFCVTLFLSASQAADLYDLPKPELVMKRKYQPKNDITLSLGYLPVGAFSKYIGAGASFLYSFSENHGWEIVNVVGTSEVSTALKQDLKNYYGASDDDLPVLSLLATTNYIFSPLYTKSLLFNSSMIYTQTSFAFGGGVGQYSVGSIPALDLGLIERVFLTPSSSLKFDFRYYDFITTKESIKNNITLMVGWAYNFGD